MFDAFEVVYLLKEKVTLFLLAKLFLVDHFWARQLKFRPFGHQQQACLWQCWGRGCRAPAAPPGGRPFRTGSRCSSLPEEFSLNFECLGQRKNIFHRRFQCPTSSYNHVNQRECTEWEEDIQRWASAQASRSNARHQSNTQHISLPKEWNIVFFQKTEGKDRVVFDPWRTPFLGIKFFTFNEKKSRPIPRFFKMSKWSEH